MTLLWGEGSTMWYGCLSIPLLVWMLGVVIRMCVVESSLDNALGVTYIILYNIYIYRSAW